MTSVVKKFYIDEARRQENCLYLFSYLNYPMVVKNKKEVDAVGEKIFVSKRVIRSNLVPYVNISCAKKKRCGNSSSIESNFFCQNTCPQKMRVCLYLWVIWRSIRLIIQCVIIFFFLNSKIKFAWASINYHYRRCQHTRVQFYTFVPTNNDSIESLQHPTSVGLL